MAHQIVKPEILAKTALGLLEDEVVLPNLIQRESVDKYRGADNDTINIKVPGVLPFHNYAWRNDRSTEITFDELTETKTSISFGGNVYSAVKVTDEQNDFDLDSWGHILDPQARAVARGLERKAIDAITGAAHEVVIGDVEAKGVVPSLVKARNILNRFRVPAEERLLVVGNDFESMLLSDDKFNRADSVGEAAASAALRNATIGRLLGFTIVTSNEIEPDEAHAFIRSAFVIATAAPSVPAGVAAGATVSSRNFALRWIRDYDPKTLQERSVVNSYAGARSVKDRLVGWDKVAGQEKVTAADYFVRGIKLELAGTSKYPSATSELGKLTGVVAPAV